MPDNPELLSLLDELDELSAWLWMKRNNDHYGFSVVFDISTRLDKIINKHRPDNVLGD